MKVKNVPVIIIAALSGLISLLIYLNALSCGFINIDDPLYVLENPVIRVLDWSFFSSVFTHAYVNWWMPLTWISLAVDYHFWELNPFGYHLTNIVLHAVNTGLVVLIADKILSVKDYRVQGTGSEANISYSLAGGDWKGFAYPLTLLLAGLLWGIHPLRVESVAWITERKDVLNGLFALASILSYLKYGQLSESGRVTMLSRYYFLALGLFVLSLMAKSVTVVIPVVLLVLDWYPLGRLHKGKSSLVLIEKIPFFSISAAMSVATVYLIAEAQFLVTNENFPFVQRLIVSGNALFEYCRLMIYPIGILPYYLIPDPIPLGYAVKTVIIAVSMGFCLLTAGKKCGRAVVLLCFVLLMLPVLAFFQNGDQSFAARFTYLPSIAPCIAAAFGCAVLFKNLGNERKLLRFALTFIVVLLLLFYAVMTQKLIRVWNNTETMWNRVVDVEPSAIAFKERGMILLEMGKYDAAVEDFTRALENPLNVWKPYIYNLYAFRGESQRLAGRCDEAVKDFTAAIRMLPHPVYFRFRGAALMDCGKTSEAADDFKRAGDVVAPLSWYWSKVESQQ